MDRFHCCATCVHFKVEKNPRTTYRCSRLGYDTNPKYKFNCWDPKENVRALMNKFSQK